MEMEKASKEKIQRKEVFQPKHVNGMSRSEILRRKFHALFGGRCLEVSCASLLVNLRFVPVCIPHTAHLIVKNSSAFLSAPLRFIPKMLPIDGGIVPLRKCLRILNGVSEIQMQRADVTV
jgi:hypothetical protein